MPTLDTTIDYIQKVHGDQKTKQNEPYWTHPVAVMNLLPPSVSEDARHAALLHDVIEDCRVKPQTLLDRGYSARTVWLVVKLTRPNRGETYGQWISDIVAYEDHELLEIKIADCEHNSDPERIAKLPWRERSIAERYKRALRKLRNALKRLDGKIE